MQNIQEIRSQQDTDSYVSVDDDNLMTSEVSCNSDIVVRVSGSVNKDSKSDGNADCSEEKVPNISEALRAIKILCRFVEFHNGSAISDRDSVNFHYKYLKCNFLSHLIKEKH